MLNTRSISGSADPSAAWRNRKTGGTGQASRRRTARHPRGRTRGRLPVSPPPVMCAMARIGAPAQEQRQDRLHVDAGRRGARLFHRGPELGHAGPDPEASRSNTTRRARLKPFRVRPLEPRPSTTSLGARGGRRPGGRAPRLRRRTRQVVLARGVEVRQLGDLAADQRAAGLAAPAAIPRTTVSTRRGHAGDPDVVQEHERLGAVDQEVVDAHRDQVDPDGVVLVREEGTRSFEPTPSVDARKTGSR